MTDDAEIGAGEHIVKQLIETEKSLEERDEEIEALKGEIAKKDSVIQKCQEAGVMVNVHFQPLPMFSVYKNLGYNIKDVPVSFRAYSSEISLPVFYDITEEQIKAVVSTIGRFVQAVSEKGN